MKRQEKFPETRTFHYFNANPKGRITSDCVIRAISAGTATPYNTVVMELAELQVKTGYDDGDKKLFDKYLQSKGFVKEKQPRRYDGTKYTGKEWVKWLNEHVENPSEHPIIAMIGGHHITAIIENKEYDGYKITDIWDCGDKCIGNYWTKKENKNVKC